MSERGHDVAMKSLLSRQPGTAIAAWASEEGACRPAGLWSQPAAGYPARPAERGCDPLQVYRSKRDFTLTPEPCGEGPRGVDTWRFVVHKHWAGGRHYDFRLELGGVLKSWAVPRGPSLDPKVQRMAEAVEDHPLAYAEFEGVIPARQYGAGKVILWDAGIWTPSQDPGQAFQEGHLKFQLRGHKLQGRWALVRIEGQGERPAPWLLIKEKDPFARAAADYSVVEALPWSVKTPGAPSAGIRQAGPCASATSAAGLPPAAAPAALPPSLGARFRTLASLRSACESLKLPAARHGGEILVPDRAGVPDFGRLQHAFDAGNMDNAAPCLCGLPFADGRDMRSAPSDAWTAGPKRLLCASVPGCIRFREGFDAAPHSVPAPACRVGLEGAAARHRSAACPKAGDRPHRPWPPRARGVRVTHLQRVIDARAAPTKIELLRYYSLVGKLMAWHLKGRPAALLGAPAGVDGELFFQRQDRVAMSVGVRPIAPAIPTAGGGLLEVVGTRGLVSAARRNVIEFHTHGIRTGTLDRPDRMVFDLVPGVGVAWTHMQEAAQLLRAFLAELGLPAFLKTGGGKGLHVVVPVRRIHDWATVKGFSQAVALHIACTIPYRFVARSGPGNRVGKIFVDYRSNGPGETMVCAWSARAQPGLGVSVPVAWGELPTLRGGDQWSVQNIHERLDTGNAPWKGYARAARGLAPAMSALGYVPASGVRPPSRGGRAVQGLGGNRLPTDKRQP